MVSENLCSINSSLNSRLLNLGSIELDGGPLAFVDSVFSNIDDTSALSEVREKLIRLVSNTPPVIGEVTRDKR